MKINIKFLAGALVCFLLVFEAGACDRYCYSCSNCTAEINAASTGKTICLANDMISNGSACINHPVNFSGKIFDCRNHAVNGTGYGYGFYIFNQNNVSIINCSIENYDYGAYLFLTSDSTISGNIIKSGRYGVYIDSFDSEEMKLLDIINDYRKNNSVLPLSLSLKLTIPAKAHSQDMANHDYFNHNSSSDYINFNITMFDRMRDAGYMYSTYLGENIAAGYIDATSVFNGWKNSPGHNAAMLNGNFTVIGIGRAYNINSTYRMYWTNDFGGYNDTIDNPFMSHNSENNKIENNVITMNNYGIFIYYSNNTEASSNLVYNNNISDFNSTNSAGNHGNNNTCEKPDGWNDDNKTGCSRISPPCEDKDGDGYGVCPLCTTAHGCNYTGNDCNDSNSSIHPNATEIYNQIDDDCDGLIDEGLCAVNDNCSNNYFCNNTHQCDNLNCSEGYYPLNHTCKANLTYCPIHINCSDTQTCNTTTHACRELNCTDGNYPFNHQCYPVCDINRDGITVQNYDDLMTAYMCFLGIENDCNVIKEQDWNLIKKEYQCVVNLSND